ncbi:helix-turn-helix domain-containing protein [Actinomadura scrupuli]|uniref:helix-turn-helix domain-containing protein n=1 Tax=Actinomadura scrupuli TaxID=559629 RepID=UPI003D992A72
MVREPLSITDRERGERLGESLRAARGSRSITDVAIRAGISPETLRKIERGRIPTPAFFTVVAVARVLGLSLDGLLAKVGQPEVVPGAQDGVAAAAPAGGGLSAAG